MPRKSGRRTRKAGSTRKSRGSTSRRKKWSLDMDTVVPEVARRVIERLGLDYAGVSVEDIRDLIEEIVQAIAENRATKPSIDSLVRNIVRNGPALKKAVAAILAQREDLTGEQIDFIIASAPEVAGRVAPRLYTIARKKGMDHVVDALRTLWVTYGRPTPFTCPRCGFRALTPDLTCMVCGASVDEYEFKESIGFEDLLEEMARERPSDALQAAEAGFVLYDGNQLLPPSARVPGKPYMELYLTGREREILRRAATRAVRG
ncbi:MAG: hypothetical protein F7C34_05125 [Desulfurococcales archaeon]|nr:hypothetical protein [Desulfurococcales archaeon]